jgi:hypothetical protein
MNGVLVYGHGYGVWLKLLGDAGRNSEVLERLGWSQTGGKDWCQARSGRLVLRGSAWITHTAPGVGRKSKNSPTASFNRKNGTKLYGLGIDRAPGALHLELKGVRHSDINKVCRDVLGLDEAEWCIEHYLTAERYIVLTPADARKVAQALGRKPLQGRGAYIRKSYLVQKLPIPILIRQRAKSEAQLSIYRINGGATWAYKMEISLRGRRRDRRQFGVDDISKLDAILLTLVEDLGLHPIAKPARWEPRSRSTWVEIGPYDQAIRPLGAKVWRGKVIPAREVRRVQECHIPPHHLGADGLENLGTTPSVSYSIRSPLPFLQHWTKALPTKDPMEVTVYVHTGSCLEIEATPSPSTPTEALACELDRLSGALVEVILPEDEDPTSYIQSFIAARSDRDVGVGLLGIDSWDGVHRVLLRDHPLTDEADDAVVVVDPSAMSGWSDFLVARLERIRTPWVDDVGKTEAHAMGTNLWAYLRCLREHVEQTDSLVVLFTVDHRPASGMDAVRPSNFWTDARVRSWIGDAGRYWCHQRYLVTYPSSYGKERGPQITSIKDEAEGLVGRRLTWRRAV